MKFKPMQDRILVREIVQNAAGLVLPPQAQLEGPKCAMVLAVGDGSRFMNGETIPVKVEVGQTVLFERHCGVQIIVADEKLLMLREGEIMGVFVDEASATLHSVR